MTSPITTLIDESHDPKRRSWVESANGHRDFPIQNLPLGVFSTPGNKGDDTPRGGIAIGERVLDLRALAQSGLLNGDAQSAAKAGSQETLNTLLGLDAGSRRALRRRVSELLSDDAHRDNMEPLLHDMAVCTLHLPTRIGDYTDFYVGIHHAMNIGKQFRPDNPLLPNYKYVPIGYHGRASSVRLSGTPVPRPNGQRKGPDDAEPQYGPSRRLDYELELGIWIGSGNSLGEPIPIKDASRHIAGLSILNDWSARDLQAWEYQPLGPFLAKNFLTSVSPWIVTSEALAPFRTAQPPRPEGDPKPLPYLFDDEDQRHGAYQLNLEVALATRAMRESNLPAHRLSRGPATNMYWTAAQMVAHHSCNGCDLHPGDLFGSGTISTPDDSGRGSLLEISQGGKQPLKLENGEERGFLESGDEVIMRVRAEAEGYVSIGFGECRGTVEEAP